MQNRASKETQWLLEEKYQGRRTKAAERDIAKLKGGEPIDYLIGFVEFAGCRIDLSQKPLIPRQETEYWTELAIQDIKKSVVKFQMSNVRILDLFAGSGCVGIAVLKHIPKAHVDFAEKEKRFLKQIRMSTKLNTINPRRYRIIQADIFKIMNSSTDRSVGLYDYIFANPPYVAESRRGSVQSSVLKYEPHKALFAGKDGLRYIKGFLKEAREHLNPGGKIYLELDSPQKKEIEKLLKKCGYRSWEFYKDQYNKWRFVAVFS